MASDPGMASRRAASTFLWRGPQERVPRGPPPVLGGTFRELAALQLPTLLAPELPWAESPSAGEQNTRGAPALAPPGLGPRQPCGGGLRGGRWCCRRPRGGQMLQLVLGPSESSSPETALCCPPLTSPWCPLRRSSCSTARRSHVSLGSLALHPAADGRPRCALGAAASLPELLAMLSSRGRGRD